MFAFLDDLDAVRAPLRARIRSAMETGGPEAATEPFWRYVAGEDAWSKLAPDLRERMRASSETLFGIELGTYERYVPDDETLAAVAPRVRLLVSADGLASYTEAARRLGQRLGRDVEITPDRSAELEEGQRLGTRVIQCPITRPTVGICGYPVRRAGCLNRALRLAFGIRIRTLLILHTREVAGSKPAGAHCNGQTPDRRRPMVT